MVNKGAEIAQGEIITLLNNDTEIIEENWLELLVTQTIRKEVGVCGPLLLFKNRTIQHAGIHPSKNALMIHGHKHEKENSPGYFGHLQTKHEVMAVKKTRGFKNVAKKIAKKQGVSQKAASAILASATRKASAKAKKKNPRLKKVK